MTDLAKATATMNELSKTIPPLMRYRVLQGNTPVDLEGQVNRLLTEGWQPQGGMTSVYLGTPGHVKFYQAMAWQGL